MRWMTSIRFLAAVGLLTGVGTAMAAEPYSAPQGGGGQAQAQVAPSSRDAMIVADITAKLQGDKQLKNAQVTVVSENGQVTLVGSLPSGFARERIIEAVRSTPGVVRYDDQMQLVVTSPEAPTRY